MRIIFNASIADMAHPGHINLYNKMREEGDYTIVILHDDVSAYQIKGKIPLQNIERRVKNLEVLGTIDKVMVTEFTDPANEFEQIIKGYHGHELIYMRGDDAHDFPGKWMLLKYDIPIHYIEYTKEVSSTKIREELTN